MAGSRRFFSIRCVSLFAAMAFAWLTPAAGYAADPPPNSGAAPPPDNSVPPDKTQGPKTSPPPSPALESKSQKAAPTAFAAATPKPVLQWGVGDGQSYWVPAAEIIGFEYGLNRFDHYAVDSSVYGSPTSNFRHNYRSRWVVDTDPFAVNQFFHPYQGSMYQGFARSAGLGFWESFAYTLLGSALWEEAGEHTTPSINDQVASGIAGNFLGEPLFRISSLLLESGGGNPGFWRELGAAVVSPSAGFNRLLYGQRFDGVFRSHDPAVYTRLELGASDAAKVHSNVPVSVNARREANLDFTMGYGLPGKPGYTYTRPFDYFHLEFTASTGNVFENIMSRGLLFGDDYAVGANSRGVWGLYGNYDYIAPAIFRISTTGASLGTTGQTWLSRDVAVQGSLLGGLGYGAAGTINAVGGPASGGGGERDYHYGVTPQELVALRLILGDRVSIDTTTRNYYVSRYGGSGTSGSENIIRADISMTVRVYKLHGITLRYVESQRNAHYENRPGTHQSVGTFSIVYSWLGQTHFGAVDWRPKAAGGP